MGGRKRHVIVDCLGLVLAVLVTAASTQDREAAVPLLARLREQYLSIRLVWADGANAGSSVDFAREKLHLTLDIVRRTDDTTGFVVLPRRWVVERTLSWLMRSRRLMRHYETLPAMRGDGPVVDDHAHEQPARRRTPPQCLHPAAAGAVVIAETNTFGRTSVAHPRAAGRLPRERTPSIRVGVASHPSPARICFTRIPSAASGAASTRRICWYSGASADATAFSPRCGRSIQLPRYGSTRLPGLLVHLAPRPPFPGRRPASPGRLPPPRAWPAPARPPPVAGLPPHGPSSPGPPAFRAPMPQPPPRTRRADEPPHLSRLQVEFMPTNLEPHDHVRKRKPCQRKNLTVRSTRVSAAAELGSRRAGWSLGLGPCKEWIRLARANWAVSWRRCGDLLVTAEAPR
ncbi:transposase [Streptomyces phaeochromogenes]